MASFAVYVEYFAGNGKPVPMVLTEMEAVRFLRLDAEERAPESALRAFRRLVETKRIRPCRIGLRNRFARQELERFVLVATELAGEAPSPSGVAQTSLAPSGVWRDTSGTNGYQRQR